MFTQQQFYGYLSVKKALGKVTVKNHLLRLGVFLRFLNGREITKDLVQEFFTDLHQGDKKNGTYNAYLTTLRLVDEYFTNELEPRHLMSGYENKKSDDSDPIQILSEDEIRRLLTTKMTFKIQNKSWEEIDEIYLLFTRFLYFTACRVRVEGINLKVQYYDPGTHTVWFVKSKKMKRKVVIKDPLLQEKLPLLMKGKASGDYLFTTPSGRPLDWQTYWANIRKRAIQAGINQPLKPHALRHSRASHLYLAGVPLEIVSLILGHANVLVTFKTYVHVSDEVQDEAMTRCPIFDEGITPTERIKDVRKRFEDLKLEADDRLKDFYRDIMMVFLKYV